MPISKFIPYPARIALGILLIACGYLGCLLSQDWIAERKIDDWTKHRLHLEAEFSIVQGHIERCVVQNGILPDKMPTNEEFLEVALKGTQFTPLRPRSVVKEEGLKSLEESCDFSSFLCLTVNARKESGSQKEALLIVKPINGGDELYSWRSFKRFEGVSTKEPKSCEIKIGNLEPWSGVIVEYNKLRTWLELGNDITKTRSVGETGSLRHENGVSVQKFDSK